MSCSTVVRGKRSIVLTVLITAFLLSWSSGPSAAAEQAGRLQDEADIRKLTICYARGTDAIGRGDVAAGRAIYQPCFTKDATFSVVFPNGQIEERIGSDAWADFVTTVFQGAGYTNTQHLIGTITIEAQDKSATMSTYLHATHVLPNGSIDVANGTYEDSVVKTDEGWQIQSRRLTLITFLNLAPTAPHPRSEE